MKMKSYIKNKETNVSRFELFNIFFNDFFFVIPEASVQNFADENTLCSFAKTPEG